MSTRVVFEDWVQWSGDVWNPVPRYRILDDRDASQGIVDILLSGTHVASLLTELGLAEEGSQPIIARAMLRYGLREIERALQQGVLPLEDQRYSHEVRIGNDDIPLLASLAGDKECDYQVGEGRDLYCLAASAADKTARFVIQGRAAGITSRPLCRECALPDTDYLCSNLSHAEVVGVGSGSQSSIARRLMGALCQMGRSEIGRPDECRPGGNSCWERHIEMSTISEVPTLAPLQLPEAVDHLDMAWRLLFGRERHLLRAGSAATVAALMLACSSPEEFESRLSRLADLLKRLRVDDDMLPAEKQDIDKDHTLQRLKASIVDRVEGPDTEEVESAIRTLQTVNGLRVGQQHSGAIQERQNAFDALGIRYPVDDWDGAWSRVRSAAADAFLRLAHVVEQIEPPKGSPASK